MRRRTMRTAALAAALTLLPLAPTSGQALARGPGAAAPARAVTEATGARAVTEATGSARAGEQAPVRYVALGDSYSSGEGNPPFDAGSGQCHRSPAAWPRMIARQDPGIDMAAHIACSGATSTPLRRRHNGEPPQLRQLRDLDQPADLVTITIGGNDIGFGPVLADCFVSDCVLDGGLRRARQRIEDDLPAALARDYRGLQRADSDA